MSYGKVYAAFVYVMWLPKSGGGGPAKIGTTVNPQRRRVAVQRFVRQQDRLSKLHGHRTCDFFWMARVPTVSAALDVERRVKALLGRDFELLKDWIDLPPQTIAETAASVLGGHA